jgi:hypothetical protein
VAARQKTGVKKAAAIAHAAKPLPTAAPVEQVDMLSELGLPITKNVERLRAAKREGPGRPAGSLNKRTVEMANYLLSRYVSPLERLAQIVAAPIDELSASLGCTKLEALQEIRLASIALKDHLHSKMPVAVDVTNTKIIHLTITEDAPPPMAANDGVGLVGEVLDLTAIDVTEKDDVA